LLIVRSFGRRGCSRHLVGAANAISTCLADRSKEFLHRCRVRAGRSDPWTTALDDGAANRERIDTMKYMLLIYNRPGFVEELTEAERETLFGEVDAIMTELQESGELIGGGALADPSQARTVRGRDGLPAVTDGPFVEAKEQFAGYVSVDCETLERAVEIAARWPDIRFGGAMEVRALMDEAGTEM
jgi:hypothetical protein